MGEMAAGPPGPSVGGLLRQIESEPKGFPDGFEGGDPGEDIKSVLNRARDPKGLKEKF